MTTAITKNDAATVAAAIKPAVNAYLGALAIAKLEREKCNAIQATTLASMGYDCAPRDAWHVLGDAEAARYYAYLDDAYKAAGYELEPGFCPALMAENAQIKAERAIIDAAEPFLDVSADKILCAGMVKYHEYVDLLVKLCVNSPAYQKVA